MIFVDVLIHVILVFLISVSSCLLLAYRNTTDVCILTLYQVTLTNSLRDVRVVFIDSFVDFPNTQSQPSLYLFLTLLHLYYCLVFVSICHFHYIFKREVLLWHNDKIVVFILSLMTTLSKMGRWQPCAGRQNYIERSLSAPNI